MKVVTVSVNFQISCQIKNTDIASLKYKQLHGGVSYNILFVIKSIIIIGPHWRTSSEFYFFISKCTCNSQVSFDGSYAKNNNEIVWSFNTLMGNEIWSQTPIF
jgi:hypothetical protein